MDWWTAEMTETVVRLALALVAVLVTAWGGGLFKLAHQWAASLEDDRAALWAEKLVLAAEQQFGGNSGEAKLKWALDQSWAKGLGIDRADIEAAVRIMNSVTETTETTPEPTLTADLATAQAQIAALQAQLAALAAPGNAAETIKRALETGTLPTLVESFRAGDA